MLATLCTKWALLIHEKELIKNTLFFMTKNDLMGNRLPKHLHSIQINPYQLKCNNLKTFPNAIVAPYLSETETCGSSLSEATLQI